MKYDPECFDWEDLADILKQSIMKILIVIDNLASGGAQRVQISLALALINKGHVVEFFTYKKEDFFKHVLRANNIKIFSTEKKIVKLACHIHVYK